MILLKKKNDANNYRKKRIKQQKVNLLNIGQK